jgi:DNA topoisomerase-1
METPKELKLRIQQIKIPPNWKNITIAKSPLDYLQATGYDAKGKIQYIYHPLFIELTKEDKFNRLKNFINNIDKINKTIQKDLRGPNFLIAFLFRLLQKTYIRVGNNCYAKENKTYGLTTLEKRHFIITDKGIEIKFNGKRSIQQKILITDKFIINTLKILINKYPNKNSRLFDPITALDMNEYIKQFNPEFTVKDFRTYYSNILFIDKLKENINNNSTKMINSIYDYVANKLGHSKGISKKAYILPQIAEKFIEDPTYFRNKTSENICKKLITESY